MKVYIRRKSVTICGMKLIPYEVCTHSTNCEANRSFVKFEKRNGKWLLWDHNNPCTGLHIHNFEELLTKVKSSISEQLKLGEGKIIAPDEIEIIGLHKILEK